MRTEPATGNMPFEGHRTCKQVREDAERLLPNMAKGLKAA